MFTKRNLTGPLTLENSGQLSLFPIGTGSAFSKTLFQNNLLLVKGKDHILIDCGTRTPEAFHRMGLPIGEVKNYCITHSHADHVGGLEEVILIGRYVARKKPNIYITKEYQDLLWDQTLSGGAALNERNGKQALGFFDYWEPHKMVPLSGFSRDTFGFQVGDIKFLGFRTMHFPDSSKTWKDSAWSMGFIIDERILFTGDTRFDKELIYEYCEKFNIELIMHDVQFFPGGVHAAFDELKTFPQELKSKMLLMHYPDTWRNHEGKLRDEGFMGFVEQQVFYDFD